MESNRVFVQDKNGIPMDPTCPARARKLLKKGRASVVKRNPFTIKIVDRTREESEVQDVTLGVDPGYSKIGFSAISGTQELISGELSLRKNISKKLGKKRAHRRLRRHRNTRYREPRFDNRKKPKGWLAPSIRYKLDTTIKLVESIKSILPVNKVTVEVAKFDTQKLRNPEINGIEYQHGTLHGYNLKNYLLEKFNYKCAYCGKKDTPLEIEHIAPKSRGGSNQVNNLTISCHKCNQDKGNKTAEEYGYPEVQKQAKKSLRSAAFMNQVRWKIVDILECDHTYGYVTKKSRIENDLSKSHVNDAFIIAGGNGQIRTDPTEVSRVRRNNRELQKKRKTFGRSIRTKRYKIQKGDTLRNTETGETSVTRGTRGYGHYAYVDTGQWNTKNVEIVNHGKGISFSSRFKEVV